MSATPAPPPSPRPVPPISEVRRLLAQYRRAATPPARPSRTRPPVVK